MEERTQLSASSAPQAHLCYINGSQHLFVKSGGVSPFILCVLSTISFCLFLATMETNQKVVFSALAKYFKYRCLQVSRMCCFSDIH